MIEKIINKAYIMLKDYFDGEKPTHTQIKEQAKILLDMVARGEPYSKNLIDLIVDKYEVNAGIRAYEPDVLINISSKTDWFNKRKNDPNQKQGVLLLKTHTQLHNYDGVWIRINHNKQMESQYFSFPGNHDKYTFLRAIQML